MSGIFGLCISEVNHLLKDWLTNQSTKQPTSKQMNKLIHSLTHSLTTNRRVLL